MTTGYLLLFYWTIVALGAALFLGTGAALVRYVRTGAFPGQPPDPPPGVAGNPLRRVAVRCGLGLTVALAGFAGLLTVGG